MTHARRSGTTWRWTGVGLILAGVAFELVLRIVPSSDVDETIIVIGFLPAFMIVGGAFLFWRGRQYAARADAARIIADAKPDVLYLRTFRSDPTTARSVFGSLLTQNLIAGLATEEEQLAEVLRPFGDLVAIGQPGEALPTPGAARIYADDDEWKEVVKRQMQEARLVVIRAGTGQNLLWELRQAVASLDPRKVLILVLNMKQKDYETFRANAEPILGASLPAGELRRRFGRVAGFIGFASDWHKPRFLALRAPRLRRTAFKPFRRLFQFALKPVFEDFGLQWQPPPVSKATVAGIVVLVLLGVILLIGIVAALLGGA